MALTALGMVVFAWRRRRDRRSSGLELAFLGFVILGFVGIMRVSGVAAEAYNQERAQIHASVVLVVGFATVVAWCLVRWRKLTLVAVTGALMVVFLSSSGLAAVLVGGEAPANLLNRGDAEERFAVTDAEVASAEWLAANREPDSIVYTDRYGKLRICVGHVDRRQLPNRRAHAGDRSIRTRTSSHRRRTCVMGGRVARSDPTTPSTPFRARSSMR